MVRKRKGKDFNEEGLEEGYFDEEPTANTVSSEIPEASPVNFKKSVFNKAIPFLAHLQSLELICSEASINADFQKWFDTLQAWFNKLTGKLLISDPAKVKVIDNKFVRVEPFINHPYLPEHYKRIMLSDIQRDLEVLTDKFGYQMPEQGGVDDGPLDFK